MILRLQKFNKIIRYFSAYCVILVICHIIQISSQITSRTILVSDSISITNLSIEAAAMNQFHYLNSTRLFQIKILRHLSRSYLFAVSDGFLFQIDPENLKVINKFQPLDSSSLSQSSSSSSSSIIQITYLSSIVLSGYSLMYFCYISKSASSVISSQSECAFADSKSSSYIRISWGQNKFVSIQSKPGHTTSSEVVIQSGKYIFSGYTTHVFKEEYPSKPDRVKVTKLAIFRTLTPRVYGAQHFESIILSSPKADEYFEDNSSFIGSFASRHAVYYMVTEPVTWQSVSMKASCNSYSSSHNTVFIVTRLLRICTDDHGGIPDLNPHNFATIAKADIVCPVHKGTHLLTKALSLEFDKITGRLFVMFSDQANGPVYTVVCVYKIEEIEESFDSDIITSSVDLSCLNYRNYIIKPNPLLSVCQKLTTNSLTHQERLIASQLAVEGLYRSKKIYPINNGPMIELGFNSLSINTQQNWLGLKNIKLLDGSSIEIILIFSTDKLVVYSEYLDNTAPKSPYNSSWLCHVTTYYSETEIVSVDYLIKSHVWIYIATKNGKVNKLKLLDDVCKKYSKDERTCNDEAPRFCGWLRSSDLTYKCVPWSVTFEKKVLDWKRSKGCKKLQNEQVLKRNHGEICELKENGVNLKCRCVNICDQHNCKVQVTNCEGAITLQKPDFPTTTNWTECTLESVRKRGRHCKSKQNCIGGDYELESCPINQLKEFKSVWTDWYQNPGKPNIYERYRAICRISKTRVLSHVEKGVSHRNKNRKTGQHARYRQTSSNDKWSEWSACMSHNIRYRLLTSCYSFNKCPRDSIRIQPCSLNGEYQPKAVINAPRNQYETIHIIIAVLGCSIVWLFIIVVLILVFYRRYTNANRDEAPRRIHRKRSDASSATYNNISLMKATNTINNRPKLPTTDLSATILPPRHLMHPSSNNAPKTML